MASHSNSIFLLIIMNDVTFHSRDVAALASFVQELGADPNEGTRRNVSPSHTPTLNISTYFQHPGVETGNFLRIGAELDLLAVVLKGDVVG